MSFGCVSRLRIRLSGVVQGVGFRPFVYRLAARHGLSGFAQNEAGNLAIEVEGREESLERFVRELRDDAPSAARIADLAWEATSPRGESRFRIEASAPGLPAAPGVVPDLAACDRCLAELSDPRDRRYRYPFISCCDCGPRWTLLRDVPYDRERTSMAAFPLCAACRREYEDPADRRFHAEGIACAACGPRLLLRSLDGPALEKEDALAAAAAALRDGRIVAIKGLGGVHLACDATDEDAVRELRRRKRRDEKPFAVLLRDLPAARRACAASPAEERLLASSARPIVLLERRAGNGLAPAVAPGSALLGVMLPYTPLHVLLLDALNDLPLVLTSGNVSDEPIVRGNEEALAKLGGVADLFLLHDRDIEVRCDDSVARVIGGRVRPVRRSRGYVPAPLTLPRGCAAPILAVGGEMKSVFALGRGLEAVLSPHVGELDAYATYQAFVEQVARAERLLGARPALLAHDLHPEYASTRYAVERARAEGLRLRAVQHHHAHMASCMAENGLDGDVIGVTFDGTGYGLDGTLWGGEFLIGGYAGFRRAGHLAAVRMPGGAAAVREPWRMALAHLAAAGEDLDLLRGRRAPRDVELVRRMIERGPNAPWTSSVGRLFDAVASILGLRDVAGYEGQAAAELEGAAAESEPAGAYPIEVVEEGGCWVGRPAPLVRALAADVRRGVDRARAARRFHAGLVEMIREICARLRAEFGLDRVVFSGGVFMNARLGLDAERALARDGFRVYQHEAVPPNDGGLCLGQLAVAAAGEA